MAKKKKDRQLRADLETLFRETGEAHHGAFADTDGSDSEWPIWYAERLVDPLNDRFSAGFTKSNIIHLLIVAERKRAKKGPNTDWPRFFAKFFAKRLPK